MCIEKIVNSVDWKISCAVSELNSSDLNRFYVSFYSKTTGEVYDTFNISFDPRIVSVATSSTYTSKFLNEISDKLFTIWNYSGITKMNPGVAWIAALGTGGGVGAAIAIRLSQLKHDSLDSAVVAIDIASKRNNELDAGLLSVKGAWDDEESQPKNLTFRGFRSAFKRFGPLWDQQRASLITRKTVDFVLSNIPRSLTHRAICAGIGSSILAVAGVPSRYFSICFYGFAQHFNHNNNARSVNWEQMHQSQLFCISRPPI